MRNRSGDLWKLRDYRLQNFRNKAGLAFFDFMYRAGDYLSLLTPHSTQQIVSFTFKIQGCVQKICSVEVCTRTVISKDKKTDKDNAFILPVKQ